MNHQTNKNDKKYPHLNWNERVVGGTMTWYGH